MAHFAIIPLNAAGPTVSHISDSRNAALAFAEFAQIAGAHALLGDFAILRITEFGAAQIKQWIEDGEPNDDTADWIKEAICLA